MTPSISEGNTAEVPQSQPNASPAEGEVLSKYSLRKDIWTAFDKNGLVTFPRPVRGRIPNFHGAADAADKLKTTAVFQKATVVKVNADKPQETVRLNILVDKEKRMIVSPRRTDPHPLLEIKLPAPPMGHDVSPAVLRAAVTRQGMLSFCQPLTTDEVPKIDLLIVGSVGVSRKGQRIGKCDGYSDLEFGYLCEIGAITPDTMIATTVHDCQVFDTLPEHLFQEHDFPVDLIVTPTEIINIETRLNRPTGILWKMLSNRRMILSPTIVALHKQRVESGEEVHLKEEDTDEEVEKEIRRKHRPFIHRFSRRFVRGRSETGENSDQSQETNKKVVRNRRPRRSTDNGQMSEAKTDTDAEGKKESTRRLQPRRRPWKRQRILFSLRIGGIAATDRVRDLKNALAARNVRPAEIAWFGRRGFAYVHFAKPRSKEPEVPIELEAVVAHLKDMKLGEIVEGQEKPPVIVEPAVRRDEQNNKTANKPTESMPDKLPSPTLGDAEKIIVPPAEHAAPVA